MRRTSSGNRQRILYLLVFCTVVGLSIHIPFMARASGPLWQQYLYNGPAGSRTYFVYTPTHYQVGVAVPLVVMLHGCSQTATDFAAGTQMNQLADQYHFIVVYPQQASTSNPYLCWNWFYPANQSRGSGEPAIIAGIVQSIEQQTSQWTIDARRIYVAGISAGAAMAVTLGATYPDIFAAIGVHSGFEYQAATTPGDVVLASRYGGPSPVEQGQLAYETMGELARIVPTIVFHGTDDTFIDPINGDQVVQQWMQTDMLASNGTYQADFHHPTSTTTGQVPGGHAYTIYAWNDANGSEVQEYWRVDGMGHSWSGGSYNGSYSDPLGPNASLAMYTFFLNHALPCYCSMMWMRSSRSARHWRPYWGRIPSQ